MFSCALDSTTRNTCSQSQQPMRSDTQLASEGNCMGGGNYWEGGKSLGNVREVSTRGNYMGKNVHGEVRQMSRGEIIWENVHRECPVEIVWVNMVYA